MSNRGDWIDFAELVKRVSPAKSARTLRRYVKEKLISSRQLVRNGKRDFNWTLVQRELAVLETEGTNAHLAAVVTMPEDPATLAKQMAQMETLMRAIAQRLGVEVPETFAGEQRRAG